MPLSLTALDEHDLPLIEETPTHQSNGPQRYATKWSSPAPSAQSRPRKGRQVAAIWNWGIYHVAFSISPQDYGFDKQYLNWIVWGAPEHYGLQIICNNIVVFMLIYAICAHIRICRILLYLCRFVTWVREHNYILAMLECPSPVCGKPQEHVLNIHTLNSKSPRHMNHPLENMSNVAKVFEK